MFTRSPPPLGAFTEPPHLEQRGRAESQAPAGAGMLRF